MTTVRFIYEDSDYNKEREVVATEICKFLSTQLDLPETIEIVFAIMNEQLLGTTIVNPRFKNRIRVNNALTFNEIPSVLVHELIHLYQIKTGRLNCTSNGIPLWDNRIYDLANYPNYDDLPWEVDVAKKQQDLLIKTYEFFASKT